MVGGRWEDWNGEKSGNAPGTIHMYGMSIKFIIIKLLNRYKWVLFMIVDIFGSFKIVLFFHLVNI